MGSRGTGRFGDYQPGHDKDTTGGSDGPGTESKGKANVCEQVIEEIILEEVARCEYYQTHKNVPPVGSRISLRTKLVGGRLAIETESREILGYLPTMFNYLRGCMEQKYRYAGQVIYSNLANKIPDVTIELGP
jgi:hypothetical protein